MTVIMMAFLDKQDNMIGWVCVIVRPVYVLVNASLHTAHAFFQYEVVEAPVRVTEGRWAQQTIIPAVLRLLCCCVRYGYRPSRTLVAMSVPVLNMETYPRKTLTSTLELMVETCPRKS